MKNVANQDFVKATITKAFFGMDPKSKLELACAVVGKRSSRYEHLDNGRKAMVASNLLHGFIVRGNKYAALLS